MDRGLLHVILSHWVFSGLWAVPLCPLTVHPEAWVDRTRQSKIFWKMIEALPAVDQTSSNCRNSQQIRSGVGILDASSPLWKGGGLSG